MDTKHFDIKEKRISNSSTCHLSYERIYHFSFLWTRRGLNPRPNGEPISFLHAYLRLDFRAHARPKLPT
ncbi:hypothetical protein EVA_08921 [gut metagenome]|uniref:Uncharacterized protein n=1 Tax=gut metagenome TaxID=749906 RepID=J9GS12_9ZZZZ